jgi:predicted HTH transcriptional regulator
MVMSAEDFASAFAAENDYVERKRGTGSREIQRAIVALSNSDGGVILIGVDDQGHVSGIRRRLERRTRSTKLRSLSTIQAGTGSTSCSSIEWQ